MTKLKMCPFCGGAPVRNLFDGGVSISCALCKSSTRSVDGEGRLFLDDLTIAVEAWNSRLDESPRQLEVHFSNSLRLLSEQVFAYDAASLVTSLEKLINEIKASNKPTEER